MITGNKGEWSEFYAFLKILLDRKLFAADQNLTIIQDKFYIVLRVIREEISTGIKIYDISANADEIKVFDEQNIQLTVIDPSVLSPKVTQIFDRIKNASETSFGIDVAEEAMTDLKCSRITAGNAAKADLVLQIRDVITNSAPQVGFSIKSMLGSPATLLNASGPTNFIFRIDNLQISKEEINSIVDNAWTHARLEKIRQSGGCLVFDSVQSAVFEKNLRRIDAVLPEILAELLKAYYEGNGRTSQELTDYVGAKGEIEQLYKLDTGDIVHKIKNMLVDLALGMTPSVSWDGSQTAYGGYIIVRDDGELVAYHAYNVDEFKKYLFANTKLETPSSGRHGFGDVYEEKGKLYIKLNLQIRFIR